jgi:hypothetical protein
MLDQERLSTVVELSAYLDPKEHCAEALAALEPHVPWRLSPLSFRLRCYQDTGNPLAGAARRDLTTYLAAEPLPFAAGLLPGVSR